MKTTALSTYLPSQLTLQIFNDMEVKLAITKNPHRIPVEQLFEMAARINKKRGFLFVSKVLGKHIPVHALTPLLTSGLLAIEYYEQKTGQELPAKNEIIESLLSENSSQLESAYSLLKSQKLITSSSPIIIAFAETATALGHAVFDCLEDAFFIATTREEVIDFEPALTFEEEHSHAVDQRCFLPVDCLKTDREVILVDDEITTGKTALNIIKEIHSTYPRKQYTILSILDWRSKENIERFRQLEQELSISIRVISLLSGTLAYVGNPLENVTYNYQVDLVSKAVDVHYRSLAKYFTALPYHAKKTESVDQSFAYVQETGRFGLSHTNKVKIETACRESGKYLEESRKGEKTLCLGTGELMYLPMKISAYMGEGVYFHSTTRSPIHPVDQAGYAIQNGFRFANPEDQKVAHFVYNIPKNYYDDVYIFLEGTGSEQGLKQLFEICKDRGIYSVSIITLSSDQEGSE